MNETAPGLEKKKSAKEVINPIKEREAFLNDLVKKLEKSTLDIKIFVLATVFRNSVDDGMSLGKRLGFNTNSIFSALIDSAETEDKLIERILNSIDSDSKYLSSSNRIVFESERADYESRKKSPIFKRIGRIPVDIKEIIKEYYLPYIAQRRVQENINTRSDQTTENLAQLFNLRKRIRNRQGEVYREIYDATKMNAVIGLKDEIKASLGNRGYDEKEYEIIETDGVFEVKFKEKEEDVLEIEKKESVERKTYEQLKFEVFKKAHESGADKSSIAWGLAGVSTPEAMALRERLLSEGAYKSSIAQGLAGVSIPEAMALRERLLSEGADKSSIAWGLAGVSTPEAMALRERLLSEGADRN